MVKYENECCDCATPNYPCLGSKCPNRNVPHYYCDSCGDEVDQKELYDYAGQEVCGDCLLKMAEKAY